MALNTDDIMALNMGDDPGMGNSQAKLFELYKAFKNILKIKKN